MKLTPGQTTALERWTNGRGGVRAIQTGKASDAVKTDFDSTMHSLPKVDAPVYRSVLGDSADFHGSLKVGDKLALGEPVSTSIDPTKAAAYGTNIYKIESPTAAYIGSKASHHSFEKEAVIAPGSFEVTKVETTTMSLRGKKVPVHVVTVRDTSGDAKRSYLPTSSKDFQLAHSEDAGNSPKPLSDAQVQDLRGGSAEQHLVTDASGTHFTPERQALHDKIIKDIVAGHKAQDKPAFVVLGGGPASGKTKAAEAAAKEFPGAITINPDDIKAALPEYHSTDSQKAAYFTHEESSYLAKRTQAEALKSKAHVILDAVGDNSAVNVKAKVDQARTAGYSAHARYVTVPTEVAQERALARGIKSGRVVQPEVVQGLHQGVSRVFPEVVNHFDTASLHDNSGTTFTKVLSKMQGGSPVIHDPAAYHSFLAKAQG